MTPRRWPFLAVAALVLVASVGVAASAATTTVLVVTDTAGEEVLSVPVDDDSEVALEYTHSVERTLVTDVYAVDDGALVSDRMLFSSFGAGLPSEAEVTRDGGRYVYHPPERRYDPLVVTTGPVADHELVVDGERHDLAELADDGTVRIEIESRLRLNHGI